MSFPRAVALAAICCSLPSTAVAQSHAIDLPAGPLGDAVATLGRQARVSIGVSDASLAAQPVGAVRGRMSVKKALDRLLRGKNASAVFIDTRTIRIVRSAAPRRRARQNPASKPDQIPAVDRSISRQAPTDIIVTASRRPEPLSSYPGSVTIVPGNDPFLNAELSGSEALVARIPSVTSTHLGPGRNKLFVRGISDSSFNGPTQATVGQYFGELRINYNAPDPDLRLYDIGSIELLAGPQGTLYGAGSLGGILRVLPNRPELDRFETDGWVGASATAHGQPGAEAAAIVNAPVVADRVGLRLSGYAITEGGYIDDSLRRLRDVNDVGILGGRAGLRVEPDSFWTIDAEAVGQTIRGADAQYGEGGQAPLTRRSSLTQNFRNDYVLGGVTATREWDDLRFVASGSFVRQELFERFDATRDGNPPAAYDLDTNVSLLAAEARLSRRLPSGANWLVGAAILSNDLRQNRTVDVLDQSSLRNRVTNRVFEGAAYGEASIPVTNRINAMLGGRISIAKVSSSGFVINPGFPLPSEPVFASQDKLRFLPSAALSAEASRDLLVYVRYQQSYRPGGLAISGIGFNRFSSDSVGAIELGMRYGAPNRGSFDAVAAVVYTRWKDVQADTIDVFGEPATANVGDAELYNLDASARWRPLAGLEVEAGVVLNRSRVWNIPPNLLTVGDRPLPGVAAVNARLGLDYAFAGPLGSGMRLSVAGRYTGPSNLGVGDFLKRRQGDWLDSSAVLRAERGRHALSLSVTNLLDTLGNRFAFGSPFSLDQKRFETPMRPRTATLKWEVRY